MINVSSQMPVFDYDKTIIELDSRPPTALSSKLVIDGVEYEPGIVYGLRNCYGIEARGDFVGKEVKFK